MNSAVRDKLLPLPEGEGRGEGAWRLPGSQLSFAFGIVIALILGPTDLLAHSPDTSYSRVVISQHDVEFKFTYDLQTLQRIVQMDTNGDDKISRAELEAAAPAIQRFFRQHIYLDLNQREAEFAEA